MGDKLLAETIAKEMTLGVLALDEELLVQYSNPFFYKCFPLIENVKGRTIEDIVTDIGLLDVLGKFRKNKKIDPIDIDIVDKDRYFKVSLVSLSKDEGKGVLLFFQDTTEERSLEEIKKDFVANVSHELRTPLASIKGYSETLLDGGMDDKETLKDFLGIIDRHATRMSRLIDDLLVLSRVESHQMSFTTERIDICEVINFIASGFQKQSRDKEVDFSLDFEEENIVVLADRYRLEQVLVNLFDNAIKYTPKGGSVVVKTRDTSDGVRVDVTDTGIGIPEEDLPRIFERFYRVDKARSRELGGTGLGLSIVKHIVQSMNGTVTVKSSPGNGTTFTLILGKES